MKKYFILSIIFLLSIVSSFCLWIVGDLIITSYYRNGLILGTLSIPKVMYCKWYGPNGKAEYDCMGWSDLLP